MSRPPVALLPSPLLGPAVWEPVAAVLRAGGRDVAVADPRGATTPAGVLEAFVAATPGGAAVVAHSNAGLYAPAVAHARGASAVVLVDAGLPPRGATSVPTAPPAFRAFLAAKADADGLLPVWTRWWGEDGSGLFGDQQTRERVEREQPRLPLSYFGESVPVPDGWDVRPCAYVAFGETYAAEAADARARGWPVTVLDGEHLAMTVDPRGVAAAIVNAL